MQTLGIDLSTDPKKVWACEIDWAQQPPRVASLVQLSSMPDPLAKTPPPTELQPHPSSPPPPIRTEASLIAGLVDLITAFQPSDGRIIGVDAPMGWPAAFVEAVTDWDDGDLRGFRKRAHLRLRATDRFVQAITGVTPMSVSTDRMGSTAMLLAEVLSRAAGRLDRGRFERASAVNGVAEVHPAAALRLWTHLGGEPFSANGYRAGGWTNSRERFVTELIGSGIEITPPFGEAMLSSGDAIDAFICALIARAVALDRTLTPTGAVDLHDLVPKPSAGPRGETIERTTDRLDLARTLQTEAQQTADAEGWIHLPRRADLSSVLGLTPGSAEWVPLPSLAADPYARWSNGDGDGGSAADPDGYGPVARFIGEGDFYEEPSDAYDEFALERQRSTRRADAR